MNNRLDEGSVSHRAGLEGSRLEGAGYRTPPTPAVPDTKHFAYADPPYMGQARKHYGEGAREVNHPLLIAYLETFDGWALSLSSPSLQRILPMCPGDVRVGAWVKPFCAFKANVNPAYAWEPVIFRPGRKIGRDVPTVRDWLSANITLQRGVSGAKPQAFCNWLFDVLGMHGDDEFTDVFPGSGAVTSAWNVWRRGMVLA